MRYKTRLICSSVKEINAQTSFIIQCIRSHKLTCASRFKLCILKHKSQGTHKKIWEWRDTLNHFKFFVHETPVGTNSLVYASDYSQHFFFFFSSFKCIHAALRSIVTVATECGIYLFDKHSLVIAVAATKSKKKRILHQMIKSMRLIHYRSFCCKWIVNKSSLCACWWFRSHSFLFRW